MGRRSRPGVGPATAADPATTGGPQSQRSHRMTGGFLGVVALVTLPFLVIDVVLMLVALPVVHRAVTTPGVPWGLRAEVIGLALVPIAGLLFLLLGGAVAGRRFRRGAATHRWLVPPVPACLVHAGAWVASHLAG